MSSLCDFDPGMFVGAIEGGLSIRNWRPGIFTHIKLYILQIMGQVIYTQTVIWLKYIIGERSIKEELLDWF